jgi:Arc/MetJ-type ribon-helix-helix transcriptional regulator
MARSKNQIETVQLTISATPQMVEFLRQLTSTGLFGKNPAEAAERLLARALEERLRAGEFTKQK